jgi:hypothetical protein
MFSLLQALWDRYGGRWSIWCETMCSLTSPRAEHTSEPEKFHWSVKKDFFNTICQEETSDQVTRVFTNATVSDTEVSFIVSRGDLKHPRVRQSAITGQWQTLRHLAIKEAGNN